MIEYLIIGTGRSGTGFMAHLLTNFGIRCGHESIFGKSIDIDLKSI